MQMCQAVVIDCRVQSDSTVNFSVTGGGGGSFNLCDVYACNPRSPVSNTPTNNMTRTDSQDELPHKNR